MDDTQHASPAESFLNIRCSTLTWVYADLAVQTYVGLPSMYPTRFTNYHTPISVPRTGLSSQRCFLGVSNTTYHLPSLTLYITDL